MPYSIQTLLNALKQAKSYPHPTAEITLIETHISWVFLTGDFVYKIKKPVDLGFLDFSTLEKRRFYCAEELRLNFRLAPDFYLDVIAFSGDPAAPEFNGKGEVFEYAVKMRQFPQASQLDRMLAAGQLNEHHMVLLAATIAKFHQTTAIANDTMHFGDLAQVNKVVLDCYQNIYQKITDEHLLKRVKAIENWSVNTFTKLKDSFLERKKKGFIRECHGDLHLRNIAIENNEVIAFDCIEFSDSLRWNDVMSEMAFLVMDLDDHKCSDLAYVVLNHYLTQTGDYAGLRVLNFYLVYRAIVRAMVNSIRISQVDLTPQEQQNALKSFDDYISLAEHYIQSKSPTMILTCGFSGSGKTYLARSLSSALPAIHIRSDVERKRLHAMDLLQRSDVGIQQSIYNNSATDKTYSQLAKTAENILQSGFNVIVDATFLKQNQRQQFVHLAGKLNCDFLVLRCEAERELLVSRIEKRRTANSDASDADLAVLEWQLQHYEPLSEHESHFSLTIDTSTSISPKSILQNIERHKKHIKSF